MQSTQPVQDFMITDGIGIFTMHLYTCSQHNRKMVPPTLTVKVYLPWGQSKHNHCMVNSQHRIGTGTVSYKILTNCDIEILTGIL